jgi:ubiquinone/menaquinone biosynthesis C-methylase UbiE
VSQHAERFQTVSNHYAEFRPRYPDGIIRTVADRLATIPAPADHPVMDVGSGTGIFTRQIAAALPTKFPVIGIEPSAKMREQATLRPSLRSVTSRDGTAEHLPVGDWGARGAGGNSSALV